MVYRVLFMGTPDFAVPSLKALIESDEFKVVGVATRPDKPAGRGRKLKSSPVKALATEHGIPVFQPKSLRKDKDAVNSLAATRPDVIVVAAYGLILPPDVLSIAPHGSINVHASLLPRWRGAAPVAAAILAGDRETGVSIMLMDEGLDTGPVLAQRKVPIERTDTTGSLTAKLALVGAELLIETLPKWIAGGIVPQPQDDSLATYAPMIRKEAGKMDWSKSALVLEREVRAYNPWPGSYTWWKGKLLRVHRADVGDSTESAVVGKVVRWYEGAAVVCGQGVLVLKEVQLEGKKPMDVRSFLNGHRDFIGSVLGERRDG